MHVFLVAAVRSCACMRCRRAHCLQLVVRLRSVPTGTLCAGRRHHDIQHRLLLHPSASCGARPPVDLPGAVLRRAAGKRGPVVARRLPRRLSPRLSSVVGAPQRIRAARMAAPGVWRSRSSLMVLPPVPRSKYTVAAEVHVSMQPGGLSSCVFFRSGRRRADRRCNSTVWRRRCAQACRPPLRGSSDDFPTAPSSLRRLLPGRGRAPGRAPAAGLIGAAI